MEQQQPTFTFHGWNYQHYFDYVSVKDVKNINVRCKLCAGRKILSTAKVFSTKTTCVIRCYVATEKIVFHMA